MGFPSQQNLIQNKNTTVHLNAFESCEETHIWVKGDLPLHLSTSIGAEAADKDDSSEDISVPSSPHTEAIQHSSVSTSNGVSSTSKAEAVATSVLTQLADQSSEPGLPQVGVVPPSQAQPSGSWLGTRLHPFLRYSFVTLKGNQRKTSLQLGEIVA